MFCLFTCPGSTNVICGHFEPDFLKIVDILSGFALNILPEGLLFKPEGLLSNLEYTDLVHEGARFLYVWGHPNGLILNMASFSSTYFSDTVHL